MIKINLKIKNLNNIRKNKKLININILKRNVGTQR